MKKAIAILSVIVAILACVGAGILFHSSYDPAEKTAKKFMEAFLKGDMKKVYNCTEESLTVPYENVTALLNELSIFEYVDKGDIDHYDILVSNAVYEAAEEEGAEPDAAEVAVTVAVEGVSPLQMNLELTKVDGKWYISDFLN